MENMEGTSDRHVQVMVKTALRMKKLHYRRTSKGDPSAFQRQRHRRQMTLVKH